MSELRKRGGKEEDKAPADAVATTTSPSKSSKKSRNKAKDPQARFNTPAAKRYRWISIKLQRMFMAVMLVVVLSKEDFGTAFGAKTGINRAHLSPLSVLSCATHNTPYLEGRVQAAVMTLVRNAGVVGEFYEDYKGALFGQDEKVVKGDKKAKKAKSSGSPPRSLSQNLEASTKFLKKSKYDKGLVKVVKGNYALSAASLALIITPVMGIGSPDWGVPMFLSALAVFFISIRSQEGSPQVTNLLYGCLISSAAFYFLRDKLSEWGVESDGKQKKKTKKAKACHNEWDDGIGGPNNPAGKGGCC